VLALAAFGLVAYAGLWVYDQRHEYSGATVPKVAEVAGGLPQRAAPQPADGHPGVLAAEVDGVAFPDLSRFGWRPFGIRSDVIGGRQALTVFYLSDFRQLRYTIVSGTGPVDNARASSVSEVHRGPLLISSVIGVPHTQTVVFKRLGRTVVMTAPDPPDEFGKTMLRMAAWRAGGQLAF
jgi:hypothetical protein